MKTCVYSICCCSDHSSPLEVRLVSVSKRWQNDLTIILYLWKLKPDSRSDLHPRWSSTGRCSWFLPRWSGGPLHTARGPADIRNPALPPGRPGNRHSSCRTPKQRLNNCQKPIHVWTGVSLPAQFTVSVSTFRRPDVLWVGPQGETFRTAAEVRTHQTDDHVQQGAGGLLYTQGGLWWWDNGEKKNYASKKKTNQQQQQGTSSTSVLINVGRM